ncbi:MAG: PaaI family thioesterase [Anaerolineales bacterium]
MDKSSIMEYLHARLGDRSNEFILPPPVFDFMQGEVLEFSPESNYLKVRFPVLEAYLNPYGAMQGGMVTAAVDNTLGPLSMLVAPPNVTRTLEMKFSSPVTPDLKHIIVEARLQERNDRRLKFNAEVRDQTGRLLARAKALHWIIDTTG